LGAEVVEGEGKRPEIYGKNPKMALAAAESPPIFAPDLVRAAAPSSGRRPAPPRSACAITVAEVSRAAAVRRAGRRSSSHD
jgi:hypothetical protein